jgi:predicted HicB family RNase H-like nuclease
MEKEYDFSKATRGKFFVADAAFVPPVHLEPEVLKYLSQRAELRGTSLNDLVNALLKKDIELIEAVK